MSTIVLSAYEEKNTGTVAENNGICVYGGEGGLNKTRWSTKASMKKSYIIGDLKDKKLTRWKVSICIESM